MEGQIQEYTDLDPDGDITFVVRRPQHGTERNSCAQSSECPASILSYHAQVKIEDGQTPQATMEDKVKYATRASSRQLKLHSPYFMHMLQPSWREGELLKSSGSLSLDVRHWCPRAFYMVMSLLHGKTQAMPRSVDIPTLGNVTAVVDFHRCFKATEFFSRLWLDAFWKKRATKSKGFLRERYSDMAGLGLAKFGAVQIRDRDWDRGKQWPGFQHGTSPARDFW